MAEAGTGVGKDPLGDLNAAIDALVEAGPGALADGVSILGLVRETQRLAAVVSSAVVAFDRLGEWGQDGARSAVSWLASRARVPRSEASRLVRRGRLAGELPLVGEAWANGDIGPAHVDVFSSITGARTKEALARDEAMLAGYARTLSFPAFCQAGAYWGQLADPDGCEEAAERRRARRDASLHQTVGGMWVGTITLDPIGGAIVADELARIEHQLFAADVAEARQAAPTGQQDGRGLGRTCAQRRADALVEMATASRSTPPDGHRPAPLFSVLVDYPTLHGRICELANGQVLTPGSLLSWLEHADIERVVFTPEARVEVSAASRFFTGATRRAIELRDRHCTHPTCDIPAKRCEVDHIVPWAIGGATTQDNGRLLCGYHNRLRNQRPPPAT